jgi:hypothetical protein
MAERLGYNSRACSPKAWLAETLPRNISNDKYIKEAKEFSFRKSLKKPILKLADLLQAR